MKTEPHYITVEGDMDYTQWVKSFDDGVIDLTANVSEAGVFDTNHAFLEAEGMYHRVYADSVAVDVESLAEL